VFGDWGYGGCENGSIRVGKLRGRLGSSAETKRRKATDLTVGLKAEGPNVVVIKGRQRPIAFWCRNLRRRASPNPNPNVLNGKKTHADEDKNIGEIHKCDTNAAIFLPPLEKNTYINMNMHVFLTSMC